MGVSEDANDAMWIALDTNDSSDWDKAIELAQQADKEDPIPGVRE